MKRIILYILILFFISACEYKTDNTIDFNKNETNTELKENIINQNVNLEEKCFQDTAANIIFYINVKHTDNIVVKGIDDEILFDFDNTNLDINSVHKDFGDRYFLLCNTKEDLPEIWELEISTGNLMFVDLDTNSINKSNILLKVP